MVRLDAHRALFISTPKAATHTMYQVLPKRYGGVRVGGFHNVAIPRECRDYWQFSVCRNPYDRLVSSFYSFNRGLHELKQCPHNDDLNKWFRWWIHHSPFYLLYPQHVRHDNFDIQHFMRCETLDADFARLPFHTGEPVTLPKVWSREHGTWQELLDAETIAVANEYYAEDFERYGYERVGDA